MGTRVANTERDSQQAASTNCDVTIIGGGLAGKAAALHLAKAGLQVVCIEPGELRRQVVGESLDWSAPAYARLYKYTGDQHYLDVAMILLHDTKSMLAMPGRTYGMVGPGWQIENWSLAYNRGYGTPGKSLPWLTINHLHSIVGLEDVDPELFRQMSAKQ